MISFVVYLGRDSIGTLPASSRLSGLTRFIGTRYKEFRWELVLQ
jgi:hypothetical protein